MTQLRTQKDKEITSYPNVLTLSTEGSIMERRVLPESL